MSWFGRKAAPPPAANGNNNAFSQAKLNEASKNLQTALTTIANQHVKRYAREIKNAAIAKARNGYVPQANLNKLKSAEAAANAAVHAAPATANVGVQAMNAETSATNAVIKTAVANNGSEIQVKWNNANGGKWVKVNNTNAPGFNVIWNKTKGKNNTPTLRVKVNPGAPNASSLPQPSFN